LIIHFMSCHLCQVGFSMIFPIKIRSQRPR
jgi:hypothetical protein